VFKNEKTAKRAAAATKLERERDAASTNVTGADLLKMMNQQTESQEFDVIVKADVQGSLTSVVDSLRLIETDGMVRLNVISSGVGNISETDVRQAASDGTIIYGFNVELPPAVKRLATRDKVAVRIYKVIYELLDDARQSMEALLAPEVVETEVGTLEVKGVFRTLKDMVIAGGEVTSGKVMPGLLVRAKRGNDQLAEAEVASVQRQQVEAKEVFEGEMCGLSLKTTKKLQLEPGDTLEFFARELKKRTLK
ncbi:MAG TPA: hypothetical protein VFQ70_00135, partial [Candidatus Saccharimonadaceae bacterium]|nr:hypothetical protein [Candidatus Saccharimonadaceae bacterium]